MAHVFVRPILIACGVAWLAGSQLAPATSADELPLAKATVPDGFVQIRSGVGGAYFVDGRIKKRYDDLRAQIQTLQADVQEARISEKQARSQIARLRKEVQQALDDIREKELFVSPATVHRKRQSQTFELAADGVLLVKARQVQIIGWDKPHVEVVVEKIVLSADDQPADKELAAIQAVHRQTTGAEALAEATREQAAKGLLEETPETIRQHDFMWSKYRAQLRQDPELVSKLNPEVAAVLEIKSGDSPQMRLINRRPFEGLWYRNVALIELDGLTYQAGNRMIGLEMLGNVGGTSSNVWRRHAQLTIYAPKCAAITVLGGDAGIDVQSVRAAVELQMSDVPHHDAKFLVKDVDGSLISRGVPLELVANVSGDVDVVHTDHPGIESAPHFDDVRGQVSAPFEKPRVYRGIGGHLFGCFVQSNLQIENLSKELDVRNDFGDTVWTVDEPLAESAYRIVSESGDIQVRMPRPDSISLPVTALSEVGDVFVPSKLDQLESTMFSTPAEYDVMHSWHGFVAKINPPDPLKSFDRLRRIVKIMQDAPRPPGVDLVSRAGTVRMLLVSEK